MTALRLSSSDVFVWLQTFQGWALAPVLSHVLINGPLSYSTVRTVRTSSTVSSPKSLRLGVGEYSAIALGKGDDTCISTEIVDQLASLLSVKSDYLRLGNADHSIRETFLESNPFSLVRSKQNIA